VSFSLLLLASVKHSSRNLSIFLIAVLVITLAACAAEPADDTFVVAELFATPGKALATIELSPTPSPTATVPNYPTETPAATLPLPTVVVLAHPTMPLSTPGSTPTRESDRESDVTDTPAPTEKVCDEPGSHFKKVLKKTEGAAEMLGCALGDPITVQGSYQPFEHGLMFWPRGTSDVYVLAEGAIQAGQRTDTWWLFPDIIPEGAPDSDPSIVPPEGLLQPERGFGYVWRSNAFIRDSLGWANHYEIPYDSRWQIFENGWMFTGPVGETTYILVAQDDPPFTTGIHFGGREP